MGLFKKSDKDKEPDLSIIDDYKEPFTWRNFWDEQVVGRAKKVKDFLQENGVLFFLLSPFQYKNRLILKLVLIFLGVVIGIVPRTVTMIDAAKDRNESSELANVPAISMAGDISVSPLESGQHGKKHVLAFNVGGDTEKGVPSTTDGFDVVLSPARGVTDGESVTYRHKVLPINQTNRLLLIYVDNSKQNDETGIFNLTVKMKDGEPMATPIEVVLSNNQETTPLFKGGTINLASLSNSIAKHNNSEDAIKDAEETLKDSLNVYKVNEQRLEASGMNVGFTSEKMSEYVDEQLIMPTLKDDSTVTILSELSPETVILPNITSSITYNDVTYTDAERDNREPDESNKQNPARDVELSSLSTNVQRIQTNIAAVNSARIAKYNSLLNVESSLTQSIGPDDMSKAKSVKVLK